MSACASDYRGGFYRRSDRAMLGGVCAGVATYFGLNVTVLRIVAVILFFAMPITLLGYIAAVLLLPSKPGTRSRRHECRRDKRRARREARKAEAQASAAPRFTAADVERQAAALEKRLARIEKYVTSSRYDLDREFRNL